MRSPTGQQCCQQLGSCWCVPAPCSGVYEMPCQTQCRVREIVQRLLVAGGSRLEPVEKALRQQGNEPRFAIAGVGHNNQRPMASSQSFRESPIELANLLTVTDFV